jgi:hypothetical protein
LRAIALSCEDLNDHETLRHDPLMAVLTEKLEARRADRAAVAGKSTLNRLELSKPEPSRYHKISYDAEAVDRFSRRIGRRRRESSILTPRASPR